MPPPDAPSTLIDHPTLIAHGSMRRVVGLDAAELAVAVPDGTVLPAAPRLAPSTGSDLDTTGGLGTGGLDVVHRAHHRPLGREVAVERVRPDKDRPELREVLLREARVTGALRPELTWPVVSLSASTLTLVAVWTGWKVLGWREPLQRGA